MTRERILAEARLLFFQRGYDATAMSHVAKASGVTTPALYWHFASKDELYFEIISKEYREFLDDLIKASREGSAEERLRAYAKTFVTLQVQATDIAMMYGFSQLKAALSPEKQVEIDAIQREYLEPLRDILERGEAEGVFSVPERTITALAITTMCEYVFTWFKHDGRLSPAEVGDLYAEFAVQIARGGEHPPVGRVASWATTK